MQVPSDRQLPGYKARWLTETSQTHAVVNKKVSAQNLESVSAPFLDVYDGKTAQHH